MEIQSFSQRTGSAQFAKVTVKWNGISIGIRKKHIRIGNKFDGVEGVTLSSRKRHNIIVFEMIPTIVDFETTIKKLCRKKKHKNLELSRMEHSLLPYRR